jgi:hypothetical protein
MNEILDALITLYAEHGVEGVREEQAFQLLCDEHAGEGDFRATLHRVRDLQEQLERALSNQPYQRQVAVALEMFNTFRREKDKQAICLELIRRRYFENWSPKQREYFEDSSRKLADWRDYFLSFTSFNPTEGQVSFVNNQHRILIRHGFGQSFRPPDTVKKNLLAQLLHYLLKNKPLDGFYYPEHTSDTQVEKKLINEAGRSFAFVQVLQSVMFDRDTWPNFCQIEYDAAASDDSKTFVFVMAEKRGGFISGNSVDNRLQAWHGAVMAQPSLELEPTPLPTRTTNDVIATNLDEIQKGVVEQVELARRSLFTNVPL